MNFISLGRGDGDRRSRRREVHTSVVFRCNPFLTRVEDLRASRTSFPASHTAVVFRAVPYDFLVMYNLHFFKIAAERGHLEMLQWARANGAPWDERTCAKAARGGHLEMLQWAKAMGCPCEGYGLCLLPPSDTPGFASPLSAPSLLSSLPTCVPRSVPARHSAPPPHLRASREATRQPPWPAICATPFRARRSSYPCAPDWSVRESSHHVWARGYEVSTYT
ncbi:uncharacterized protein MICPUCDRAFT_54935 [Micromonas pusilla CCMP1545]|uniref:Predicted protein n=1 Tax=Micromonas pusilla (strain CCMP1545) TaxID=564608 RepID=C1NAJ3_MICPC|nr:uncharacterized protein MICPUCDRAFT_54935 [Micromonas pusilla CCMP1545]EEH50899.1 predicted protein [Micromonas pusilla CCMP1545]|eukprot:XP_003064919.1 predicted protein [Micromonas pusilla CCMP1545]